MTDGAPESLPPPDPFLGTIVSGRYRILERLGEGGMGAVYRAEHLELEREVAIKMLAPELSSRRVNVERFQREARTASKIGHPNIVDVFDLGRAADGTPYLVMQLLDGWDLDEELVRTGGFLPPKRVAEILAPVANALDTCHARGVIHRDIKPSNIFLARLGDGRVSPQIVDFGLAMLTHADERLTKTGFLSGTPHYLPPEAAHGDLAGASGDIYALATIAYEALSGALPFDAENPNGVLVQKVTMEVPPMSAVAYGTFPEAVEAVLRRALDPDPAKRHATATELVEELAKAIEANDYAWGPDVEAGPKHRLTYEEYRKLTKEAKVSAVHPRAGATVPDQPLPTRTPLLAALGGVGVLVAVALAIVGWVVTRPDPPAMTSTEVPREAPPAEPAPVPAPSGAEGVIAAGEDVPPEPPPVVVPVEEAADPPPPEAARVAREPAEPAPAPRARPRRDRAAAEQLVRAAGAQLVRGEVAAAIATLREAREADPSYAPTYRSLGLAYEQSHRDAAAREAYERYLRLAPSARDAERIRARIEAL